MAHRDLDNLTEALNQTLEARIGSLLGDILAARTVASTVSDADAELTKQHALQERVAAKLRQLKASKAPAGEISKLEGQEKQLAAAVDKLAKRRDQALSELEQLTSEIGHA